MKSSLCRIKRTVVLWEGRNSYKIQDVKIWTTSFVMSVFFCWESRRNMVVGGMVRGKDGEVGGMVRGEEW